MTDLHEIWQTMQVHRLLKSLKIQNGGRPIGLKDPFCKFVRYRNFSIFKMAAVRHLGFLKLKF